MPYYEKQEVLKRMWLFSFGERKREAVDDKRAERPEFGGFMLRNQGAPRRNILDVIPDKPQNEIEVEGTKADKPEVSVTTQQEHSEKPSRKKRAKENPNNIKSIDTVSGNSILSKGWEGSNMSVFRSKRKK